MLYCRIFIVTVVFIYLLNIKLRLIEIIRGFFIYVKKNMPSKAELNFRFSESIP